MKKEYRVSIIDGIEEAESPEEAASLFLDDLQSGGLRWEITVKECETGDTVILDSDDLDYKLPEGVEAVCEVCGEPCEYNSILCLCKKHEAESGQ